MNIILAVENISYRFEQKQNSGILSFRGDPGFGKTAGIEILKNISFKVEGREIIGIAGESGAGKSTLAKVIAGIIQPSSGKIIFNISAEGENQSSPVQILFQNNGEILNPFRQIDEIVEEAVITGKKNFRRAKNAGQYPGEVELLKERIFKAVNFPGDLRIRKGYQLSGGEQQRAALARILAVEPQILILDEPFSSQDFESQENFMNLFKKINEEFGTAIICISHNLGILRKLCGRILIMFKGEIVEQGAASEVLVSPAHPYTKYLIKAEEYSLSQDELKHDFLRDNSEG